MVKTRPYKVGFLRVMENMESHGIREMQIPGLGSP